MTRRFLEYGLKAQPKQYTFLADEYLSVRWVQVDPSNTHPLLPRRHCHPIHQRWHHPTHQQQEN
jgi:hypothetical protein